MTDWWTVPKPVPNRSETVPKPFNFSDRGRGKVRRFGKGWWTVGRHGWWLKRFKNERSTVLENSLI